MTESLAPILAPLFPSGTEGSLRAAFDAAQTFEAFLPTAEKNADLWAQIWHRADVPEALVARVEELPGRWRLLVLSADWCGDASNTVPVLARLAERAANLELRLVDRDAAPDLRDSHLTDGRAQSIPVAIVLDEGFEEQGWWGPRPGPLQRWVKEEGLALDPTERYRRIRRWYAQDRGLTTLEEVVSGLEEAAYRMEE